MPRDVGTLDKRGIDIIAPASLGPMPKGAAAPPLPQPLASPLAPLAVAEMLELGPSLAACCKTDREDGLFTTVVDEQACKSSTTGGV